MRWTVHLEGGPRRVNHAAVVIDDHIYSFGGYCSTEEYNDWDPITVHMLNTTTYRWFAIPKNSKCLIPYQRYGHTTVAYGHKVYMWGGRNNVTACDTLSCFDTRTLKWSTPPVTGMVPYAKDGHSACVIGNKMYVFGGFEYLTDQYSNEVHCLNLDTMVWKMVHTKGPSPSYRDFHTAVPIGNRMYIFGGRGDLNSPYNSSAEIYCSNIFCLDTIEEKWYHLRPTGRWPDGRRSHSSWYHEGYMYVFGGFNSISKEHFNDLFRYSVAGNRWEHFYVPGTFPSERRRQVCLLHDNKVFLFGGTSPCPHHLNVPTFDDGYEKLLDCSDLHVLDYAPTLKTLSILKVIEYNLDISMLPRNVVLDIKAMTLPNRISRPINQTG